MQTEVTIRQQIQLAKSKNKKTFDSILPCNSCQTFERYTSTGACIQCQRNHSTNYNSRHRKERLDYAKNYYSDLDHKLTEIVRAWLYRINDHAGTDYTGTPFSHVSYTLEELKSHLGGFLDHHGWTWDDHGTTFHIDHRTSVVDCLSQGISDPDIIHALDNVHLIHVQDNRTKHSKTWKQFLAENPDRAALYNYNDEAA